MNKFNHLAILACLAGLLSPNLACSELDNVQISGILAYASNPHMPLHDRKVAISRLYGSVTIDQRSNKDLVDKLIKLSQLETDDANANEERAALRRSAIETLGYIFSRNRDKDGLALNPQDCEENLKKVSGVLLQTLEKDPSAEVRGEAAFRFGMLTEARERTPEEIKTYIFSLDKDIVRPLTPGARRDIAYALRDMPLKNIDDIARRELRRGLQDPDIDYLVATAIGKNKLDDPETLADLRSLAGSQDTLAAQQAIRALGLIGDKSQETFQVLDHALRAKNETGGPLQNIHYAAVEALQCINDPEGQACYILNKYLDSNQGNSINSVELLRKNAENTLEQMRAALKASPALQEAQSAAGSPAPAETVTP